MKRTAEFVLGLIGGIIGLIFSVPTIFGGQYAALTGPVLYMQLIFTIFNISASIGGIVGGIVARTDAESGGWIMIISAVVGLLTHFFLFFIPAIPLLIGGFIGVSRKNNPTISE